MGDSDLTVLFTTPQGYWDWWCSFIVEILLIAGWPRESTPWEPSFSWRLAQATIEGPAMGKKSFYPFESELLQCLMRAWGEHDSSVKDILWFPHPRQDIFDFFRKASNGVGKGFSNFWDHWRGLWTCLFHMEGTLSYYGWIFHFEHGSLFFLLPLL